MPGKKKPAENFEVDMGPVSIPVDVFYEYRSNVRVAQGKRSVLLRIPLLTGQRERDRFKAWCINWMREQWRTNPRFRMGFFHMDYASLERVYTYDRSYALNVEYTSNKTASGKVSSDEMVIRIPGQSAPEEVSETVYKVIHKLIERDYRPQIEARLQVLHGGEFSKSITSVSLRNMTSKWGSCSNTGKMSLSTRLLFAPKEVQDYVMIHELCHLDQLNHSQAFWDLVELYDPLYEMKEKWLKEYGHLCDVGMGPIASSQAATGLTSK